MFNMIGLVLALTSLRKHINNIKIRRERVGKIRNNKFEWLDLSSNDVTMSSSRAKEVIKKQNMKIIINTSLEEEFKGSS